MWELIDITLRNESSESHRVETVHTWHLSHIDQMNAFLRSGALADEIRDIGAGSQLVELLVSEAPSLFKEALRLRRERTERERLSSDIADEGNEAALVWEKSENVAAHKRRCCDRSILGEEALLERWQPSQRNIGWFASPLFFSLLKFSSFFLLFSSGLEPSQRIIGPGRGTLSDGKQNQRELRNHRIRMGQVRLRALLSLSI